MEELRTQNNNIEQSTNYGAIAIALILVSTILQSCFGFARDASPIFKAIIGVTCWGAITFSLLQFKRDNNYPKTSLYLIFAMGAIILLSTVRTLLFGTVYEGNKLMVLLGNMYGPLDLLGLTFVFAIQTMRDIRNLINASFVMITISIVLLILNYEVTVDAYFLTYISAFSPVFIPYISTKEKMYLFFGILLAIFSYYGGGRQAAILLAIAFFSLASAYIFPKRFIYYISLSLIFLPFVFLAFSLVYGSIFEYILQSVNFGSAMEIEAEDVAQDNRTFLWMEVANDLDNQSVFSILFGRGAVAYYESKFFETDNRLGIEVPMLQWFMQAGVFYILLFTIFTIYTISRIYRHGNNKLCKIASILIAGFYFNSYISNLVGCSIMQFGLFFLYSIANNEILLDLTDEELEIVFSENLEVEFTEGEEEEIYGERNDKTN